VPAAAAAQGARRADEVFVMSTLSRRACHTWRADVVGAGWQRQVAASLVFGWLRLLWRELLPFGVHSLGGAEHTIERLACDSERAVGR